MVRYKKPDGTCGMYDTDEEDNQAVTGTSGNSYITVLLIEQLYSIQGVNISLSPTGASAVTGSDGRYEFANLEPGLYTVQGMKNGFESNTKTIKIVEDQVSSGDMMLKPVVSGFRLNVDYLDFGSAFNTLTFKIINASESLPMSWEIIESLNWLTVTPNSGNIQGGQEVTLTVTVDRSLINHTTTGNITIHSADMEIVLPVSVSL